MNFGDCFLLSAISISDTPKNNQTMGKLDVSCLRHLTKNDMRVLVAVEMGMKNHDLVPTDIIINIARLRHGTACHIIYTLI
jgi:RIO kinase 2